jgi:2,3-diaminopropionate biosynthesis protein SbnB
MPPPLVWLSSRDCRNLLTADMAYEAVRQALACHARGDFQQPLKPYIRPLGHEREYEGGRFIAMPGYLAEPLHVAGIKWISGFPSNVDRGLARASGILVLNSVETGIPLAVMDCTAVSAWRTAAVAAIAFDLLAPQVPRKVGILGSGPIARAILEALVSRHERNIARLHLFDLRSDRARELARELSGSSSHPLHVCDSSKECVEEANVVVTATTASRPYIQREWVGPGMLIIALSFEDCTEELFLAADKVVVDDFDQACREGKFLHRLVQAGRFSRERVHAELGELVVGAKPGRECPEEIIYVNPMGMAIEDVALAHAVYQAALARGIGQVLQP